MRKHFILTSLVAIATTSIANAATDLTFDGKYSLATDAEGIKSGAVSSEPIESNFKYSYSTFDGTTVTEHNNVSYDSETEPDYANIKYLNSDGDAVAYTADAEFEDAQAYTTSVAAERTITMNEGTADEYVLTIKTAEAGQNLYANGTADKANYTYQADGGEEFLLSEQPTFTESYDLLTGADSKIEFTGDKTAVSATNGVTEDSLDGSQYILHASNGLDFRLTEDGSGYRRVSDGATVNVADYSDYEAEFTALKTAYDTDKAALDDLVTNTQTAYDAVKDNYEAALGLFATDENEIAELTQKFESQEKAKGLYEQAEANYAKAGKQFTDSHDAYEAATALYSASIEDTIANVAQTSIDEANTKLHGTIHGLISEESSANRKTTNGKDYHGNLAIGTTTEDHLLALDAAIGDRDTLSGDYVKTGESVVANLQSLNDGIEAVRADFATGDALTLQKANSYTDSKVNTLEKNLSGGVAASTALSAVSVGNVKKGEVSVGGGYGYYNSQSAMAFGAAMGLSDRWSVNAGAGIASGDKTQMTFRAGTNYKFKLF